MKAILREADNNDAYFCTLGNEGGGDFSQEAVAFSAIKTVPSGSHLNARYLQRRSGAPSGDARPTTADTLWPPFVTKSYCYRPEAAHQHIVGGGWDEWHQSVLAEDGEPFILPEVLKAKVNEVAEYRIPPGQRLTMCHIPRYSVLAISCISPAMTYNGKFCHTIWSLLCH